ncbi:SDR family oxidoreductase [Frigidibacter sp. ROC022]|uniref:SDR family oxidoreductase n=1 Tax=Frigidibacter sp. ROC022 TaxID=2971796 RepID=UPI00215AC912|nr:SDR family oxidoreductase [Frigidibacter sp. ROC022]MCR8726051.1 SDR family oxidoreductase [Frigidibacter sp. ROC022]
MAGAFPTPAQLFDLSGQVALITGASRGLGWGMAQALAAAGADVVLVARGAEAVEARAAELRDAGLSAHALALDISGQHAAEQAVAAAQERFGQLDILLSNVAASVRKPVQELGEGEWQHVLTNGVTVGWRLARAAAPPMRQAGQGRMIFVSSINARIVRPEMAAYAAGKAALEGLVRSLAVELGPDRITANAIAPGYFLTDGNAPLRRQRPEFHDWIAGRTALGRWGMPDNLATAALYLASPASSFTTGSVLLVDGGITVKI